MKYFDVIIGHRITNVFNLYNFDRRTDDWIGLILDKPVVEGKIIQWLIENFPQEDWEFWFNYRDTGDSLYMLSFKNDEDAMAFKLTWN